MAISGLQLLAQQGPRAGQAFDLNKPVITIGREASNDIVLEDPQVSRHHARLTLQAGGYVVEDLGSTNGTFINEQRLMGTRPINPGDKLRLGDNVVLSLIGRMGAGETAIGQGAPQTMPPSFGPPPPPPPSFGAPPPPPMSYGAPPPPQKKGVSCWAWGCGCLVLILVLIVLVVAWIYFLAPPGVTGPIIDFFKQFGINLV